jgi:hypothetical protein
MNEHNERLVRLNAQIVANAARATLECKRDADDRVEAQRATITRLQQELAAKDTEVNNLRAGLNVEMARKSASELRELNTLLDMARKVKDEDDNDEGRASA